MAPVQFGILQIPYQMIDVVGPLDILSCCSKGMLTKFESTGLPASVAAKGVDIEFHYIGADLNPTLHTANAMMNPTTTVETCPKLDYLLIGGPDPAELENIDRRYFKFMADRLPELRAIFTTCTGGMVIAAAGMLDGIEATTNHMVVPLAVELFPNVKWTRTKQWVVDGKFWTAGGACAGMDMFAHFVIENYGREVAEAGLDALDFEPRDVDRKRRPLTARGKGLSH